MLNKVSIVKCPTYGQQDLGRGIAAALELADVSSLELYRDKQVLVKINLINGSLPFSCANTHVEFTRAVVRHLRAVGAAVTVADSSGPFEDTKGCFESSGYAAMCKDEGVELSPLSELGYKQIPIPAGKRISSVLVSRLLLQADLVVSLPKIKTHAQTVFTGGVKNWFGALPLSERRRLHRLAQYEAFSESIVDLYSAVGKGVTLMDAVTGMEGNGPSAGRPKQVGLVLASENAANLDVVACKVMGLGPSNVHTVKDTIKRGMAQPLDRIEVVGEPLSSVECKFSIPPRLILRANPFIERLTDLLLGLHRSVIEVEEEKCTACGHCANICPVGAIEVDKYCRIDYSKCIRCYCCFEVCPNKAISLRQAFWGRALRKLRSAAQRYKVIT